ncbi:MAG: hypothetical protein ABEH77_09565 [Halobacteriaceae archaeon]
MTAWRAGTASATITPEEPLMLGGYWAREGPAEGAEHDLRAEVLALSDGAGGRAVLVSLDLLFVPDGLRAAVVEACDVTADGLFVTATHTHSGPETRPARAEIEDWDPRFRDRQAAYLDRAERAVVGAVERALADPAPATVALGRGRAGFAMNRRVERDGEFGIGASPDRPVDHEVPVLRVGTDGNRRDRDGDDGGGTPAALVFGYACHPTTRGAEWRQYSADWVGYAKAALRERYPGVTPLFVPGCAGDQAPFPRDRPALAKRHGEALANAVEAGAEADPRPLGGRLDSAFRTVDLALDVPDRAALEAGLDAGDAGTRGRCRYLLSAYPDGVPDSYAYPVQRLDVGDLTLVGLAGEPVVAYADRLDAELDGPTWTAGYCHEYCGYVPTPRIIAEGGYEGGRWVENTPFPGTFAPLVEERIAGAV